VTQQELYDRIVWNIYGSTTPEASVATYLQGVNGLIEKAHHEIMTDWNYWFMETSGSTPIVIGTAAYNLPTRFKKEINVWTLHSSGQYNNQLTRLGRGEAPINFRDPAATTEYPQYYEIWNGQWVLKPIPSSASTLMYRYYQYLGALTNLGDSDALTNDTHGADAIIARVVMDFASNIDYADKYQPFAQRYQDSIKLLREKDQEYKRYGQEYVTYKGL
jgi:hypothetical protein